MVKEILNSEAIIKLAQKDYAALAEGKKSYELLTWLKDELILRQIAKQNTLNIELKALTRIVNLLGFFRQDSLTKCDVSILDRALAQIKFEFDLCTLNNAERRRLNHTYNLTLEELTEDEEDETYAHMM